MPPCACTALRHCCVHRLPGDLQLRLPPSPGRPSYIPLRYKWRRSGLESHIHMQPVESEGTVFFQDRGCCFPQRGKLSGLHALLDDFCRHTHQTSHDFTRGSCRTLHCHRIVSQNMALQERLDSLVRGEKQSSSWSGASSCCCQTSVDTSEATRCKEALLRLAASLDGVDGEEGHVHRSARTTTSNQCHRERDRLVPTFRHATHRSALDASIQQKRTSRCVESMHPLRLNSRKPVCDLPTNRRKKTGTLTLKLSCTVQSASPRISSTKCPKRIFGKCRCHLLTSTRDSKKTSQATSFVVTQVPLSSLALDNIATRAGHEQVLIIVVNACPVCSNNTLSFDTRPPT